MAKNSLIVGGAGALGRAVVDVFKRKGWRVASMDLANHDKADTNIILKPDVKIQTQLPNLISHVKDFSSKYHNHYSDIIDI